MSPTNFALCHHRHANGNNCGSPALRGEQFCYFHHPTRGPISRTAAATPLAFDLPPITDHEDAQIAVSEIMRRIADATLDIPRANLLLRCVEISAGFIRT